MSHFDRDADIVWLELAGFEGARVVVQEASWGLVETDSETGAVVAMEFWKASTVLPAELLEALPAPARPVVIEAQHAGPDRTLAGPPVD